MTLRHGRRLGVDVGRARVGIAVSDPEGLLATPVQTLQRTDEDLLERMVALAREYEVIEVVVGLPLNLAGAHTASTEDALNLARDLDSRLSSDVMMVDERLTTVSAHQALRANGKSQRETRSVVDQVAAVMVLQHALDSERISGRPTGTPVAQL